MTCYKIYESVQTAANCTPVYTDGYLTSVKVEDFCPCGSNTDFTIRLDNVKNLDEIQPYDGTFTISTITSDGGLIGTGEYDLGTLPTLLAGILEPVTITRELATQGSSTPFAFNFTIPGIMLDGSIIRIGVPVNQAIPSGNSIICTDPTTNEVLTCTRTADSDSTYNYIEIDEWKCEESSNCNAGTTFPIEITMRNPAVAAPTYDTFTIQVLSPSSNLVYEAMTPIYALPELEIGALNNHMITHQNTHYTLSPTEYIISYDTTSEVPVNGKFVFTFPENRIWNDGSNNIIIKTGDNFQTTVSGADIEWDSTGTWLTKITIDSLCTAVACPIDSYQFKFSGGINNPDYVQEISGDFMSYTTDSIGSVINRDIIPNPDISQVMPTPMDATITRGSTTLGVETGLTVTFTTENQYPNDGLIIFKLPIDQMQFGDAPE